MPCVQPIFSPPALLLFPRLRVPLLFYVVLSEFLIGAFAPHLAFYVLLLLSLIPFHDVVDRLLAAGVFSFLFPSRFQPLSVAVTSIPLGVLSVVVLSALALLPAEIDQPPPLSFVLLHVVLQFRLPPFVGAIEPLQELLASSFPLLQPFVSSRLHQLFVALRTEPLRVLLPFFPCALSRVVPSPAYALAKAPRVCSSPPFLS
mmetsp:Transcript_12123/g.25026  ORF Transcript_12123/g.25026 Transcript_12123/m.25026 type:complete len:202 (+) Transcript_12123:263-868(+)